MGFIIDGTVVEELKETDSEYDELQICDPSLKFYFPLKLAFHMLV
ncbi:hypothetical protein [Clostridium yunnanense]|nr:hypothetical protein [Clostridium yunnanense]